MNHCRKCQSDYEKPGTCNCFAPQVAAQPAYSPWVTMWTACAACGTLYSGVHTCAHTSKDTLWTGGYVTDAQS